MNNPITLHSDRQIDEQSNNITFHEWKTNLDILRTIEPDKERQKWTNKERQKWTNKERQKWTNKEIQKWTNKEIHKWTNKERQKWTNKEIQHIKNGSPSSVDPVDPEGSWSREVNTLACSTISLLHRIKWSCHILRSILQILLSATIYSSDQSN